MTEPVQMQANPAIAARPVTASNIVIQRAGRVLLSVSDIAFGVRESSTNITAIVGPNGAGKSVLIKSLCGLLKIDSGQIAWAGRAPDAARRQRVGLLLQKPVLLRRSAQANLVYALRQTGKHRTASHACSIAALEQAGLGELRAVPAHRLSGGEQQRLALVRALLLEPEILFLDEATANVDPASTLVIEQQLLAAARSGLSVVMISHDQAQVKRLADQVVLMHKGRVIEQASRHRFFEQPAHPLTRRWIDGELLV